MKKHILKYLFAATIIMLASCKTDDVDNALGYSSEDITNVELNEALQDMGYNFDEDGELICDELVTETTTLDLSNRGLTSIYGLAVFESLTTVDLSFNEFGTSFNFRELPEAIESVNLQGNETLDTYYGLILIGSGTVPRPSLKSLVFPESAKWNLSEVVQFSKSDVGLKASIKIMDTEGNESTYSYLRTIPDVQLKLKLKELYPSMFQDESGMIDLSESIAEAVDLVLDVEYSNLEGVEYIISNSSYQGSEGKVVLRAKADSPYTMTFLKPTTKVTSLSISNVNTPNGINLVDATELSVLRVNNNESLTELSLADSFVGESILSTNIFSNELCIENCENLRSIVLPQVSTGSALGKVHFTNLPALTSLDLSNLTRLHTIVISGVPSDALTFPIALDEYSTGWGAAASTYYYIYAAIDNTAQGSASYGSFYITTITNGAEIVDMSLYYGI